MFARGGFTFLAFAKRFSVMNPQRFVSILSELYSNGFPYEARSMWVTLFKRVLKNERLNREGIPAPAAGRVAIHKFGKSLQIEILDDDGKAVDFEIVADDANVVFTNGDYVNAGDVLATFSRDTSDDRKCLKEGWFFKTGRGWQFIREVYEEILSSVQDTPLGRELLMEITEDVDGQQLMRTIQRLADQQ